MSIYATPCRVLYRRIGGILPSTSSSALLCSPKAAMVNNGSKRSVTDDPLYAILSEFKTFPVVQGFNQFIKDSCNFAQNLVENASLSGTALDPLGLYIWWKPSSWYRVMLESLHTNYDLSWLATVISGNVSKFSAVYFIYKTTLLIRMATFYLPGMILWKKTRRRKIELSLLSQMRSGFVSCALYSSSFGLFITQYCGLKKMADTVYPGWTAGGLLSFTDLTVPDPVVLPFVTAICFAITSKKWIETLEMQKTVSKWLLGIKPDNAIYPIVACSYFVACNVPSIVCIYWITSSIVSNVHATVLKNHFVRSLLHIRPLNSFYEEFRRIELLTIINELKMKRTEVMTATVKKSDEAAKESSEARQLNKLHVQETKNADFEDDSLFQKPCIKQVNLSNSKIAKLMEEQKQESAASARVGKSKLLIKSHNSALDINKIVISED
ncbi:unnamed protein product [Thelazia callipaeda]|uniref:Mitochondrial inner membrane protein COX18 n=1 Tax=Thelazia callipaeda TaxID=103827 RepID=A0A0N5CWA3_THECL|nr:unnamed protein product [Thelazia callipaeda]